MAIGFPPSINYPLKLDTNRTLFLVYNTSEAKLSTNNPAWSEEIDIEPVSPNADEIWSDNGFANIGGELFYYDAVAKNSYGKIYKFKRCARNLGGKKTKFNHAGSWVRGFVVAEHHNQLVDATLSVENYIIELEDEIIKLEEQPACIDDVKCPEVIFETTKQEPTSNCAGVTLDYIITINGTYTSFKLDFGDGESTTSAASGSHEYPPNSKIDPIISISNTYCSVIQTPIERTESKIPKESTNPTTFKINLPPPPIFPNITLPDCGVIPGSFDIPQLIIPQIDISPLSNIPININIQPPEINIPNINVNPVTINGNINFGPAPIITSTIVFGPAPSLNIPSNINFGPAPIVDFNGYMDWGDVPIINLNGSFDWGNPPSVNYYGYFDWGSPPDLNINVNFDWGTPPEININANFDWGTPPEFNINGYFNWSTPPEVTGSFNWSTPPEVTGNFNWGTPPEVTGSFNWSSPPTVTGSFDWGSPPTVTGSFDWGSPPTVTGTIDWSSPPAISVDWGSPPVIEVSISCPGSTPFASTSNRLEALSDDFVDDFDQNNLHMQIESSDLGIPSEIKIIAPEFPEIKINHNIPETISVNSKVPDRIEVYQNGPIVHAHEIKISESIPNSIELKGNEIPKTIILDSSNLPNFIDVRVPDFPSIKIDASNIPDIKVVGIPDSIEVKMPTEITARLEIPENLEIPLVYKGGPVPIQFDSSVLSNGDGPCFTLVPCDPKK
jgi:hypothetical protein